jgi:hypothetical protein
VTYAILALLLGIVVFAHPKMRQKYHDNFEVTHRFLGWTGTALVWVQVCHGINMLPAFAQVDVLDRSPHQ